MSETEPRNNKSKEEIEHDIKLNYEQTRQRKFAKEVLYPFLIENSISIEDAKNMLYAALTGVQQSFHMKVSKEQTRLSEVKTKELDPAEMIIKEDKYDRDRALLSLFDDESVAVTESLLKGCKMAIESFEREAATKTPLKDLPAELLD